MSATPEQLEQAALNVVAVLGAIHNDLPLAPHWDNLEVADQRALAMTACGALYASCQEKAAMFGVPVPVVFQALAASAVEMAEQVRRGQS